MIYLSRNICVFLSILYFSSVSPHSWRPFEIKLYDPSYTVAFPDVMDFNMTIDDDYISFYYDIKREFRNPFLHLEYLFDDGYGNYNMVYVNKTISVCTFLVNRSSDIVLRILLGVAEKFGNLPKRCPIKVNKYYAANLKVSADNLPPVMPEKNVILSFDVMSKEKGKFTTYVNMKVLVKLARVFKKE